VIEPRDFRPLFFIGAACICFALVPVAADYVWVALATGAVYCVLALAAWLDARSRRRD
jgi:hypothetical protein